MVYFFHHYELPLILHRENVQQIINNFHEVGNTNDNSMANTGNTQTADSTGNQSPAGAQITEVSQNGTSTIGVSVSVRVVRR